MRACIPAVALALGARAPGPPLRSGVGDRILKHPPFYASGPTVPDTGRVGHFPIATSAAPRRKPGSIRRPVAARRSAPFRRR